MTGRTPSSMTQVDRKTLERLEQDVKELLRVLRGSNGDVGIIAELKTLTMKIDNHINSEYTCPIKDVMVLLYGAKDDAEKRGIVTDIVELKRWKKSLDHLYLVMVGAIIVGVINAILQIILH